MKQFDHLNAEKYWNKYWEENQIFKTVLDTKKPKKYILDMFPYPSGTGLHVGHPRGFTGSDILARFYKMNGYNVLHPMGFDSFGLPAENYAKKNKILPSLSTKTNIDNFRRQLKSIGFGYDWDRELATTDPDYFKWTQWIFLQIFNKNLAFKESTMVNWCPGLGTILANEEVVGGISEIGSHPVYRRALEQWSLKITDYAQRLDQDLELLEGSWPNKILVMQKNWIGKSTGYEVKFNLESGNGQIEVYTTRLDTIPSTTYLLLAPEHPLVSTITSKEQKILVDEYLHQASLKSDLMRQENQEFTGVFTGSFAINPYNGKKLPIWIADFVLAHYAKGAVFGDAHDTRDFAFAKKYGIELDTNIYPIGASLDEIKNIKSLEVCFDGQGCNESGISSEDLRSQYGKELVNKQMAKSKTNFRLKDWGFSRQRYWGEPIPIVYDQVKADGLPISLDTSELPLLLPEIANFDLIDFDTSKDSPEPILSRFEKWINVEGYYTDNGTVKILKTGEEAPEGKIKIKFKREANTMPQWAGSSWYYLRFMDPKNELTMVDQEIEKYWGQVDIYIGGAEHAVLHLLYARFWHKILFDLGLVSNSEPFKGLMNQGLVMSEGGVKMSKSLGNVVNPDEIVNQYGGDTLRCYEMFLGPFDQNVAWSPDAIVGIKRFLDKIYQLSENLVETDNQALDYITNHTIKEVTEGLKLFKFNTSIAKFMEWLNEAIKAKQVGKNQYLSILKCLSIFAPFMCEQINSELNPSFESLALAKWPEYDKSKVSKSTTNIAIQVNGKLRGSLEDFTIDCLQNQVEEAAIKQVPKYLGNGVEFKKVIYIPNRLINFIVL
jgi:leucyl-tRNA synthetase